MKKKIKAVADRVRKLAKAAHELLLQKKQANARIDHWEQIGKEAVKEWKVAERRGNAAGKQKAKRKAKRARRKLAFWLRQRDIARDGFRKTAKRLHRQRKKLKILKRKAAEQNTQGPGFVIIDGRQVPKWMSPWVLEARRRGLWSGYIVSGFRTPEYSESLCIRMCGRPSCPGLCAGRATNHACPPTHTGKPYEGAIDVSDYYRFAAAMRILGSPLKNDLPIDRVHFSYSGK